jgi:hypothetical protein
VVEKAGGIRQHGAAASAGARPACRESRPGSARGQVYVAPRVNEVLTQPRPRRSA